MSRADCRSLIVEEERSGGCGAVREWVKCGTQQICSGKYAVYMAISRNSPRGLFYTLY